MQVQCAVAIGGTQGAQAFAFQVGSKDVGDLDLILDNQDEGGEGG